MSIYQPAGMPSSMDVATAIKEVMSEYDVSISVTITPSVTPKLGPLYVCVQAEGSVRTNGNGRKPFRGEYFPSNGYRTLTALMYGLVMGLEGDLESLRLAAQQAQQGRLFDGP